MPTERTPGVTARPLGIVVCALVPSRQGIERRPTARAGNDPGAPKQDYIGVSRTTFSTLASSTVSLDKYSSAAT